MDGATPPDLARATALFVSNNGLADHIGQAQVIPYLKGLASLGHKMTALTIENRDTLAQVHLDLGDIGTRRIWRQTGYGRLADRGLAAPRLARALDRLTGELAPDILHCRSYMPLSGALNAARRHAVPLIFDMRGFWIDERLEGGIWKTSRPSGRLLTRWFRAIEARGYAEASAIVVLTHDAKTVVEAAPAYRGAPISVIPCSVDQERFSVQPAHRARVRAELGFAPEDHVLTYLGSASPLYRMELLYSFFAAMRARHPRTRLLFIGGHDPQDHVARAREAGVTLETREMVCRRVPHAEVPGLLNAADLGISMRIDTPSSLGVSATKVGEYLACGLPVISNVGVGDIQRILKEGQNGIVLRDDGPAEIERAVQTVLAGFALDRAGIKAGSQDYFSMEAAVGKYDALYRSLLR